MKKLLLVALIAFGAPAFADSKEKCIALTRDLFALAVANAPYEVMEKHISTYKDYMLHKEDQMLQFMLMHIYKDIGWTKMNAVQPNQRTVRFTIEKTCSEMRIILAWR